MNSSNTFLSSFYNVYYFDGHIFKVVGFKRDPSVERTSTDLNSEPLSYDEKLSSSISRSRRIVLEYALCNDWKYFATFTLDKAKYDRFNLEKFRKDLSQWIRDNRKKYPDIDFKFLFVPEQHLDGAWHLHGLFGDISSLLVSFDDLYLAGENIPLKLLGKGYFNWLAYNKKFGFCSFGLIKDPVKCAFYISKYITKAISSGDIPLGSRCIFASQGLHKACLHSKVFGFSDYLEGFCTSRNEFCSFGMTKISDDLDWTFSLDSNIDFNLLQPLYSCSYEDIQIGDSSDVFDQMILEDF